MKNKKNVPDIRFKGFAEEWEEQTFRDVAKISSAARVHKNEWTNCGVPFFRSSDVISAYKGDNNQKAYISFDLYNTLVQRSGKLDKDDILITGGGTIGIPYIILDNNPIYSKDADLIWIKLKKNLNSNFAYYYFFSKALRKYISSISHIGTIAHYTIEQVQSTPITKPSFNEQQAIGDYFKNIDRLINTSQTKLDKLKNIKKACLEKMFSRNESTTPELRFKGFTEKWKDLQMAKIGNTFNGLSGKTKDDFGRGDAKFITYMNVFLNPVADLCRTENVEIDNKQNSVQYGDILFTVSSETPEEVGMSSVWLGREDNIYLNSFCFGYRLTTPKDPYYMAYLLRSKSIRKKIAFLAQGISRYNISKNRVMEIVLPFPDTKEQKLIGSFFKNIDDLIAKTEQQINKLRNIKKACLDKMFVNTEDKI